MNVKFSSFCFVAFFLVTLNIVNAAQLFNPYQLKYCSDVQGRSGEGLFLVKYQDQVIFKIANDASLVSFFNEYVEHAKSSGKALSYTGLIGGVLRDSNDIDAYLLVSDRHVDTQKLHPNKIKIEKGTEFTFNSRGASYLYEVSIDGLRIFSVQGKALDHLKLLLQEARSQGVYLNYHSSGDDKLSDVGSLELAVSLSSKPIPHEGNSRASVALEMQQEVEPSVDPYEYSYDEERPRHDLVVDLDPQLRQVVWQDSRREDHSLREDLRPAVSTEVLPTEQAVTPSAPSEEDLLIGSVDNPPPTAPSAEQDTSECVICLAALSQYAIIPCGHLCLCEDCAQMSTTSLDKCPICREKIVSKLRIY